MAATPAQESTRLTPRELRSSSGQNVTASNFLNNQPRKYNGGAMFDVCMEDGSNPDCSSVDYLDKDQRADLGAWITTGENNNNEGSRQPNISYSTPLKPQTGGPMNPLGRSLLQVQNKVSLPQFESRLLCIPAKIFKPLLASSVCLCRPTRPFAFVQCALGDDQQRRNV